MALTTVGTAMRWLRFGVAQAQTAAAASLNKVTPRAAPSRQTSETGQQPDVSRFAPGGDQFVQPDQTTCGSSSLVMARMINTPTYGDEILGAAGDGTTDPGAVEATLRPGGAGDAPHDRRMEGQRRRVAVAVADPARHPAAGRCRQLTVAGGSGRPGVKYGAQLANPLALAATYDAVTAALDAGDCVPLFIGDDVIARHVVLVTGHERGRTFDLRPVRGQLGVSGQKCLRRRQHRGPGWSQPWFVITPG